MLVVALLVFGDAPPWLVAVAVAGLLGVTGLFGISRWKPSAASFFLSPWIHRDQVKAAQDYPFYEGALAKHRRLLGLSRRAVAKEARISILTVRLFEGFPEFIPRPEILERLQSALALPPDYFKHGGSYGPKCSLERLLRYDKLGYGRIYTLERVRKLSQKKVDEILQKVEDIRWEELRKEGKVS